MSSSLASENSVVDGISKWCNDTMNNWTMTFSEAEYLQTYLGARYRSLAESVALSVVYAVILVTGVVGNLATCVVIVWNSHMHTATNYYLFSLAISDTVTLVLGMTLLSLRIFHVRLSYYAVNYHR